MKASYPMMTSATDDWGDIPPLKRRLSDGAPVEETGPPIGLVETAEDDQPDVPSEEAEA